MTKAVKMDNCRKAFIDDKSAVANRFRHANHEHPAMQALLVLAMARAETRPELFKVAQQRGSHAATQSRLSGADGRQVDPVEIVSRGIKLHALPRVVLELQQAIDDPASSAEDLARIISLDPGLSAYLLRIVNSAMYSFPSRIDTISRAVAMLGTRQISVLAIGVSVFKSYSERPVAALDFERFWRHSIACAILSRAVAGLCGKSPPERYFVAGLLHDVGRLAIFEAVPDLARQVVETMEAQGLQLVQAEQAVLGFDHAKLGAILLRKWNFPVNLAGAVFHHHAPCKSAKTTNYDEASVVHVADILSKALGYGTTPTFFVPALDPQAWESLGLRRADLARLERELDERFEEAMASLR